VGGPKWLAMHVTWVMHQSPYETFTKMMAIQSVETARHTVHEEPERILGQILYPAFACCALQKASQHRLKQLEDDMQLTFVVRFARFVYGAAQSITHDQRRNKWSICLLFFHAEMGEYLDKRIWSIGSWAGILRPRLCS
jgi:hypothetical protein